jgi:hypothetical protein
MGTLHEDLRQYIYSDIFAEFLPVGEMCQIKDVERSKHVFNMDHFYFFTKLLPVFWDSYVMYGKLRHFAGEPT